MLNYFWNSLNRRVRVGLSSVALFILLAVLTNWIFSLIVFSVFMLITMLSASTPPVQWFTMDSSVTAALMAEPDLKKTWTQIPDGVLYNMRGLLPPWIRRYEVRKKNNAFQIVSVSLGIMRSPTDLAYSQKPDISYVPMELLGFSRFEISTGDRPYQINFWAKTKYTTPDMITADLTVLINIAAAASGLTRIGAKPKAK